MWTMLPSLCGVVQESFSTAACCRDTPLLQHMEAIRYTFGEQRVILRPASAVSLKHPPTTPAYVLMRAASTD
jgi:hypothetical protein